MPVPLRGGVASARPAAMPAARAPGPRRGTRLNFGAEVGEEGAGAGDGVGVAEGLAGELAGAGVLDATDLALDLFLAADDGDVGGAVDAFTIEHAAIRG